MKEMGVASCWNGRHSSTIIVIIEHFQKKHSRDNEQVNKEDFIFRSCISCPVEYWNSSCVLLHIGILMLIKSWVSTVEDGYRDETFELLSKT